VYEHLPTEAKERFPQVAELLGLRAVSTTPKVRLHELRDDVGARPYRCAVSERQTDQQRVISQVFGNLSHL